MFFKQNKQTYTIAASNSHNHHIWLFQDYHRILLIVKQMSLWCRYEANVSSVHFCPICCFQTKELKIVSYCLNPGFRGQILAKNHSPPGDEKTVERKMWTEFFPILPSPFHCTSGRRAYWLEQNIGDSLHSVYCHPLPCACQGFFQAQGLLFAMKVISGFVRVSVP